MRTHRSRHEEDEDRHPKGGQRGPKKRRTEPRERGGAAAAQVPSKVMYIDIRTMFRRLRERPRDKETGGKTTTETTDKESLIQSVR